MASDVKTLIYGRKPVLEALNSNHPIDVILIAKGTQSKGPIAEIIALSQKQNITVQWTERSQLDRLATSHQGIIAEIPAFRYASVDSMLSLAQERHESPLLLILDQIQDVHNLGSLIRTAEAVGAHGIVIPERRAAAITPAVMKSSAGAITHLLVAQVTNLVRVISSLKKENVWVVGLDMAGDQAYDDLDWQIPLALVIGSEGKGLSRLVRETCDFLVRLPMRGKVESLNAAVAGSIVLYTAWRSGAGDKIPNS